ncbi:MAG: DUF4118 domain-containing protein, partial [Leptolyngbyaceae bacterium]|nr:DUF4118 domain-containing protein [Leptolyngbyaceae bacterium]
MPKMARFHWLHYGAAIGFVLLAWIVVLGLDPWFSTKHSPLLLFSSAVGMSAWYGGLGPGLAAT